MISDYQFDTRAISLVMGVPCPGHWCTNGIYDSSVFEWRSTPSLICYMLWAQVYVWPPCYLQGSMDASDYLLYDMICYVSGLVVDYCPVYDFMQSNTFNHNSRHFMITSLILASQCVEYKLQTIPGMWRHGKSAYVKTLDIINEWPHPLRVIHISLYKVVDFPTTDSQFLQHWIWL